MAVNESPVIQRRTTLAVPPAQRRDFYTDALAATLIPMRVSCSNDAPLDADVEWAGIGPMAVRRVSGCAHRVHRGACEISRSTDHRVDLLVNPASRQQAGRRARIQLRQGDTVVLDSRWPFELDPPRNYEIANFRLPPTWLQRRIPNPDGLIGSVIPGDQGWGRSLSRFLLRRRYHMAPTQAPDQREPGP